MWKLALFATIFWLSSTGHCQEKESFWCVQFFNKSVPHPLHMEIDETTPVGTVIRKFELPKEDNVRVVVDEGDTEYLRFNNKSQALIVKKVLKTRLNSVLRLSGVCTHNVKSYNYHFNFTVNFLVNIKEFSDPPQFINLPIVHEVPEKTEIDEEIFKVEAADLFDVNRSNITYKLLKISAKNSRARVNHMFTMDSQGKVYLKEKLDYDKGLRFFYLKIEIEDSDNPPQKNTSTLTIKVTDNDDQPPRFAHLEYDVSLIGEKPITTKECHNVRPLMKAEDLDPVRKSVIKYKIVGGDPPNWIDYFRLQEDNGTLCQLKTLERSKARSASSDPDSFPTYVLRVEAYQVDNPNRKHTAKLTVKIDNQNIHAPTFSQKLYRDSLNEYPALRRRDKVITVTATDDDYGMNKQFRYEIIQNYKNGFSIDPMTGDIFVSKPMVVDREIQDQIELKVRAVEMYTKERKESDPNARVILTVNDVNDNAPRFRKSFYSFQIKDNLGFHELVHPKDDNLEARDPDLAENGTVVYTITRVSRQDGRASFNDISRFKMDKQGNMLIGQSLRDLRRKGTFPEYRVTVKAEDEAKDPNLRRSSTAQVDIKILEANNFPPVFQNKRLSVSVSEATAIGSRVTKLEATDKDGDEDLYLTYRITGGNNDNTFSISKSGYLTTARVLDREAETRYKLTVVVSDGVHEEEATVEVSVNDVNDHAPVFTKSTFEFTLMENATEGETFGTVSAIDEDTGINGQITYSLVGKGAEYFGIKPNGDIFVRRISKLIDKEQNDNIILQVKAVDAGKPPSQDVAGISIEIVDVNDNAPVFSQSTYKAYIDEGQVGSSNNNLVQLEHKIEAIDSDKTKENRNIRYQLIGPGSEKFSLHAVSGLIRVKNPASIDCELKCEYQLKIIARDQKGKGLEGQADLLITVNDLNDNAPTFEEDYVINIEPWTTIGTKIKTIQATDNDKTDQNNKIMYLLRAGGVGKFQMDFDTGDLVVIDKLTRPPQLEEYVLEIKAIDSGNPRLSADGKVTIRTTVNQQPVLQQKHYFEIPESLPVDFVIGKINATNPDDAKGLVQKLKYVIPGEYDVPFSVDADSGVLETKSTLDAETLTQYIFPIIVTDNGYPPSTVSTTVTINVTDVNDEPPRFTYDTYVGSILEDDHQPIRKQKVKLETAFSHIDKDQTPAFQTVKFSLSGKESKLFSIDALTSEISVIEPGSVDCEKRCWFEMMVHISNDADLHLTDSAVLIINVTDANDNAPIIEETPVIRIPRATSIRTNIARVLATDNDYTAENNQLAYFLMGGGFDKFALDMDTGSIKVIDDLSREPQHEEYRLHVMVEDSGMPKQTAETLVKIQIPINTPPTLPDKFLFDVREDATINTSLGLIGAMDPDVLENRDYLEYALNNEAGTFVIDKLKGELFVARVLDAEISELYVFLVTAVDHGIPQHTATTTVTVRVTDVNDNPPVFEEPFGYKTSIPEGFEGYLPIVPAIKVKDEDVSLENRETTFILKGHGSEFFQINSHTAEIAVKYGHHLDCEHESFYSLQLVARNKKLVTKTLLEINIEDLNDHTPEFLDEFSFALDPDTKVGTTIGQLQARDMDRTSKNNRFTFFLKSGSFEKFAVDAKTGDITVIDKLSREPQKEVYNLQVLAMDFGYPSLSSNTTVKIIVPVNKPVTVAPTNAFHVSEGVSIGTQVGTVNASDPDMTQDNENSLTYILTDTTVPFRIGNKTGIIETAGELDAESASTYQFGVIILDSDLPPTTATTTVTIVVEDINDNPPQLSSKVYRTKVSEGQANGRPLVLNLNPPLLAEDKDKNLINRHIRYYLKGKNSDMFRMNPRAGILKIKDTSKLDSENQQKYKLTIVAFDGTFQTQAHLVIEVEDINDNRPEFSGPYFYQVNPRATIGTKFGQVVAKDKDATSRNNRILYVLSQGSGGKFGVDFNSGDLYVASNLTDSPQEEEYNLVIQGFDTGEPSLASNTTVRVRVALNKAPVVDPNFVFQVPENMTIGSTIGIIPVFDPDIKHNPLESIQFSISDPTNNFAVSENDGKIVTKIVLDRETQEQFIFTVYCENDGAPSHTVSTTVTVILEDVNDNKPIFKSGSGYHGTYKEGDPRGIITLNQELIATDADVNVENQNIVYRLVGKDSDLFQLNTATGSIKVRAPSRVHCNYKDNYILKIIATDQGGKGHQSVSTINIEVQDINDNAPRFTKKYHFRVPITAKEGTVIGSVMAIDNDCTQQNNRITYLLKDGGFGKFKIDPDKGEIIIADSLVREPMRNEYSIVVKAVDNGAPGLSNSTNVTILVPVNHPPSVQNSFHFYIMENSALGQFVGKITAEDRDLGRVKGEKLTFTLVDKAVPFSVHPLNGEIRTNDIIDREETELYRFKVMVTDNGVPAFTATTNIIITIKDFNDNAPQFIHGLEYRGTVVEDDRNPILKQKVELSKNLTVIDRDATNSNRQIRFSLKGPRSRLFKIDSTTGDIYVDRPGKIDRELNREFKFKIVATDQNGQGLSTEADLIVEVEDVNDHDPRFVQALYEFVLPSIVETGYEVGRLIAIDRDDTSPNNKLLYIFESDALGKFKIDVGTGVLTLLEGFFSKPRKTTYTFTVAAMDMGFPSRKTKAQVIVNAPHMVYNDHAPKFEGRNVFILKEELPVGSLVGTLQVTDEDRKKNNSVNLIIDPADERYVPFAIKNDGSIITTQRIDRDAGYEYFRFTVHATDNGTPSHNTSQEVGIIVDDINDNPPHFTMDTYQHMVSSNFPASTIIATPFAFDDVDKIDSVYQYSLLGGTPGYFYIDQQTGIIRTTDLARSLKSGKLEFKVVAQDLYNKTLTAEAKLNIQIMQTKQGRKSTCCRVPC